MVLLLIVNGGSDSSGIIQSLFAFHKCLLFWLKDQAFSGSALLLLLLCYYVTDRHKKGR